MGIACQACGHIIYPKDVDVNKCYIFNANKVTFDCPRGCGHVVLSSNREFLNQLIRNAAKKKKGLF